MIRFNHLAIKSFRENLCMSQERAAELAGVNQQQWSRWESGESSPTADSICKIMNALLLPIDSLVYMFTVEFETVEDRE